MLPTIRFIGWSWLLCGWCGNPTITTKHRPILFAPSRDETGGVLTNARKVPGTSGRRRPQPATVITAAKSQQQLDIEIPGDGRAGEPEPLKPTRSVVTDVARQYIGAPSNDPLLVQAKSLVIEDQRASLSYLQRKLRIGYNRAAAIIEELHRVGVISNPNEQGVRSVLAQAQA